MIERGGGGGNAAMIRWILLDREIDDTAMSGGKERGRRYEGLRQQERKGEEPGGNKSSGKKNREPSKIKKGKFRSVMKEGADLLFLSFISSLLSLRGGGLSPRASLISLIGSAAPFLCSLRATEGGEGGGATSKEQQL